MDGGIKDLLTDYNIIVSNMARSIFVLDDENYDMLCEVLDNALDKFAKSSELENCR